MTDGPRPSQDELDKYHYVSYMEVAAWAPDDVVTNTCEGLSHVFVYNHTRREYVRGYATCTPPAERTLSKPDYWPAAETFPEATAGRTQRRSRLRRWFRRQP